MELLVTDDLGLDEVAIDVDADLDVIVVSLPRSMLKGNVGKGRGCQEDIHTKSKGLCESGLCFAKYGLGVYGVLGRVTLAKQAIDI